MNSIKKTVDTEEGRFDKFLEKIEFIYFDNEYTECEEKNYQMDKIYEDLINSGLATEIGRGNIEDGYIKDTFSDDKTMGYIAKIQGEYVGYILFKKEKNHLYLSLVATKPKLGMPLGQILIAIMEEIAIQSDIGYIKADSVAEAIEFYKKHNWEVINEDEVEKTFYIKKQVIAGVEDIVEDPDDDEDLYDLFFDDDFEEEDCDSEEEYDEEYEVLSDEEGDDWVYDFEEYANRDLETIILTDNRGFINRTIDLVLSHF